MEDNIPGDGLQAGIPLDDLNLLGKLFLQLLLLGLVQVFIFQNLVKFLAQIFVLDQHFRHPFLVEQRHGRAIVGGLLEVVFTDVIPEPGIGLAAPPQKRRAGKGQILGLGQAGSHVFRKRFILGTVGLVHHHDDVVPAGQERVFLPFGIAEFLNQCKDDSLVLTQELSHLFAVLGLCRLVFLDRAGTEEIAVDLAVQIIAVGDDHKGEIAGLLAEDLADVKDHGKAFARTLSVPEHTQFALLFLVLLKRFIGIVYADELVVLGDDLLRFMVVDDKVLDVVQQPFRRTQPHDGSLHAGAFALDSFGINLFLFILRPLPFEEVFPTGGNAADLGFNGVGEETKGVAMKEVGNVFFVAGEIVVKGGLEFDVGVSVR